MSKERIERKKESWRKYREMTEMNKEEETEIYNKLIEKIPVRVPIDEKKYRITLKESKLNVKQKVNSNSNVKK